jgi:hypothetical protein
MRQTIVHKKYSFASCRFFRFPWLVKVRDKDIMDVLQEKVTVDRGFRSLSQPGIHTQTNAATHHPPGKRFEVLRFDDVMRQ